ncbi:MAG: hypothetical protein AAF993_09265 [Pseudomonadota bacterium]
MNTKLLRNSLLINAISLAALASSPAAAENDGFFAALSKNAVARSETATQRAEVRLTQTGDRVAYHLERHPEDIEHIDDIAKLVAVDTMDSVEDGARAVAGGVVADSVRSVFSLFKRPQK